MQTQLESIRTSHPDLYRAFSALPDGEAHLRSVRELDRYWERLNEPVPEAIVDAPALPPEASIEATYDIIYAGGTLGMLHAAVMARRYGRSVMVFDRNTPGRSTRDWNISRSELFRLEETGVFSADELESVIARKYKTGWVEFHKEDGSQKRLYMQNVLDCAIEADRLLGIATGKVESSPGCSVRSGLSFERCWRFSDHVVVETRDGAGKRSWFRSKVLVDVMGILSPIAMQLSAGRPQTHVCPTVGTIASGLEGVDFETGEILASTAPADMSGERGRQLIWEGFPAKGDDYITYLFFYDEVDSANDKSLIGLFDTYFRRLGEYKKPGSGFRVHRPVYGIIPAYFHDGFGRTRPIADDRILLFGDAASLASPLTFCGFGSMVRNLGWLTAGLERALLSGELDRRTLECVSAYEPNVASMANLMKYMCFDRETDEPNFVNDLMNEVMVALDELPERYREAMFRDEMKIEELAVVMLRVAWRYPKVLKATWDKLGVDGSLGFLKNLSGWAFTQFRQPWW
ncbi:hypothetical protein [Chlorobium sp. N1]|uniref:hypothetical protein n=1 Tax=Chlorobium sp. N1 TaxID=2491138 RepID=UPI00103F099B|nr:hypothetical protein [Chlorobium sp. N1]TCD48823.1 hypothetical protein E0L29_02775 [Chlorobium sp. N1]